MIITLTTDFGNRDGFPSQIKGVILSMAPDTTIVDISHEVPPYDIRRAAWLVARARSYFPSGTIHVVVVDPGVGSGQKRLAVEVERAVFLLPDNGMISLLLEPEEQFRAFVLDKPQFFLPNVSSTFHGRDIFAPVAAHLSTGVPLTALATSVAPDLVTRLETVRATRGDGTISGEVVYIDRYGNLVTNIPSSMVEEGQTIEVEGRAAGRVVSSYQAAGPDSPAGLTGSHGHLEIVFFKESAEERLKARVGSSVTVHIR